MMRLVVSKITATPSAKMVSGPDWIDGIQRLTSASTELKLVLKNVMSKKTKRKTGQRINRLRSVVVRIEDVFST